MEAAGHGAQSTRKVIFITGANQGLGIAILQVAAQRDPGSTYILASRVLDAGYEARDKLRELCVTANIDVVQLDVTNDDQITAAVRYVEEKFGTLDGGCWSHSAPPTPPFFFLLLASFPNILTGKNKYSTRQQCRHKRPPSPSTIQSLRNTGAVPRHS
jgi:NAD(P)-dependent dehydrogenase (short-subunit alcohol dehydrogenase family)